MNIGIFFGSGHVTVFLVPEQWKSMNLGIFFLGSGHVTVFLVGEQWK